MFRAMESPSTEASRAAGVACRWQWSRLAGLAPFDLYAVLAARQLVFAVEQQCAFQDADGLDFSAWHLLGWVDGDAGPSLAAYLRVIDPGVKYAEPSIGRVLTVSPWRGIGLGRVVMTEGIARAGAVWPGRPVRIAAQQRLERFYASLDFRTVSAPYIEDGIPHVEMVRSGG
jgi:ElaA protein